MDERSVSASLHRSCFGYGRRYGVYALAELAVIMLPIVVIRPAQKEDAAEMADLLRASIAQLCEADHGSCASLLDAWLSNKTTANVVSWIGDPANIMLVATIRGEIAGVGALRTDGYITLNYVAPRFRLQGVSKTLVGAFEQQAKRLQLPSLRLESTKTALKFYVAVGFVDAGEPSTKHGFTCYPLIKQL